MKPYWYVVLFACAASAAHAATVADTEISRIVAQQFPGATILAQSAECKSTTDAPIQRGIVIQQHGTLHAVIATTGNDGWQVTNLPRAVQYSRGSMSDFLDEFGSAEARQYLDVRCTRPDSDPDITIRNHGAFIANRGKRASDRHLCFTASSVYNSWVCYWTPPGSTAPELSFVQFNAD